MRIYTTVHIYSRFDFRCVNHLEMELLLNASYSRNRPTSRQFIEYFPQTFFFLNYSPTFYVYLQKTRYFKISVKKKK